MQIQSQTQTKLEQRRTTTEMHQNERVLPWIRLNKKKAASTHPGKSLHKRLDQLRLHPKLPRKRPKRALRLSILHGHISAINAGQILFEIVVMRPRVRCRNVRRQRAHTRRSRGVDVFREPSNLLRSERCRRISNVKQLLKPDRP